MNAQPTFAFLSLLLVIPFLLLFISMYRKYTGLSTYQASLALFASAIACGVRIYYRDAAMRHFENYGNRDQIVLGNVSAGLLIVFAAAFIFRLWGRWIGGLATEAERQPGVEGVRAWFSASNVFVGLMVVLCAWLGEGVSPLLGGVGIAALLAAFPVLKMESTTAAAPAPVSADLSAEREKIVSMLQAGKLTADESAELLQALSATAKTAPRTVPLTGGQRFLLIGGALVLLGFFLPWFRFNLGSMMKDGMGQVQSQMQSLGTQFGMPEGGSFPNLGSAMNFKTNDMSVRGADIGHGLGWFTLLLAAAAALLPYVATTLDAATARTVRFLCLGLGAVIVFYLLTENIRNTSIGLILVVAGYAMQIAGALRVQRAPGE